MNNNNNNMEKWAVCAKCQNHVYYSYAFNIALLIVIIVITTTERLFECMCLLSRMLQNLGSCILLQGFTNFSVDPYYDPLSLVMIKAVDVL